MFKEKLQFFFFNFFSFLIKLLGFKFSTRLGKLIGTFVYYFIPIRKSVVLKNLSIAFPNKSINEITLIAKKNYQNIFITFFEFMYAPFSSKEEIQSLGNYQSLNEIKLISEKENGTIFFTGHFGNWELGAIALGILIDKPLYVLAKKQSNNFINNWLTKAREVHGNKMIWLGPSIRHLIEILGKGGSVGIVADQRGPIDSPRINFFNRKTAFPIGSATIAVKTNCNIVFLVFVRKPDFNYECVYEIFDKSIFKDDVQNNAILLNQSYARFLENVINKYPEQYFWMHNLWKY
ncbi:MAG: lysophospholipid acyltransferase family protein [Melioribacteraceae bacterium]|nr:lysophospholipid acyltransferase family protein [Melioribacteraceae bacterium]